MKTILFIKVDTNDADYITSDNVIDDETLEIIKPVIKAIKDYNEDKTIKEQKWNFWNVNHSGRDHPSPYKLYVDTGRCTEEQMDYFMELCPHGEDGIHTIEEIKLFIGTEVNLL